MTTNIVVPENRLSPLVVGNKTFRSFYDIRVSDEDLERAKSELGETEEIRNTSLRKLKEELKKDKVTHYRMDDAYLLRFLRYRKFDCDKTYKHIKNFYRFRKESPDVFTVPSNLEFLLEKKLTKMLPYRDEEGSIIYWMDFRHVEDIGPLIACQMITAVNDVLTMDPSYQINGVVCFWDMRGFSSTIHYITNPWAIQLLSRVMQDCYPCRLKKLIAINVNKIVQALYATIRHVIKKKNRDRIVLLGEDLTELKNHINPALLPKEYGGIVEEEDCIYTKYIMDNLPYIEYEHSFQ